jgi:hypothetical protein
MESARVVWKALPGARDAVGLYEEKGNAVSAGKARMILERIVR